MLRRLPLLAALLLAGCYSVGFRPHPGLDQLAVPVFGNDTLRRGVEHSLTRHVRRELLETTPIRLAHQGEGRAELRGKVTSIREGVLVSGPAEEVLESSVNVSVRCGVYRDGKLWIGQDRDGDGVPDGDFELSSFAEFDTTRGETRDTATEEALRDLAEMIVFQLGARSDDRHEPNDTPAQARELHLGQQVGLIQRNPDWFRLVVPPHKVLQVGLYHGPEPLTITATDAHGQELTQGVERADEGRLLRVAAGAEERPVWLRVTGEDTGAEYTLWLWLKTAPPE